MKKIFYIFLIFFLIGMAFIIGLGTGFIFKDDDGFKAGDKVKIIRDGPYKGRTGTLQGPLNLFWRGHTVKLDGVEGGITGWWESDLELIPAIIIAKEILEEGGKS